MLKTLAPALVRGIYRWDLVALTINGVIGGGIFGLPSSLYQHSGAYSLLALVVCGLVAGSISFCFAEVGSRFIETGGPYLYARTAFGPIIGFEAGWLAWVTRVTAFATLCNLFVTYLGYFWPAATTGWRRTLLITVIVTVFTAINLVGVRHAASVSDIFAVGKLIPILFFIVAGLFYIKPAAFSSVVQPTFKGFSLSVLLAVFAFGGFEYTGMVSGETRDPRRNLPFAILASLAVAVLIYLLIQLVCIGTLPGLASSQRPLADASQRFLGGAGATIITLGALISIAGTMNIIMLAAPRLLFAMGEQGQLPAWFASIHPRLKTPHTAIFVSSAVILVFTLSGTFIYALTISAMARLLYYATTCAALPVLRRRQAERAAFQIPFGTAVAVLTVGLCLWVVSSSAWRDARDLGIAAAIGLALYAAHRLFRTAVC